MNPDQCTRAAGLLLCFLFTLSTSPVKADASREPQQSDAIRTLSRMSLAELLKVTVTSVEHVDSSWFGTPAALSVIREQDIANSGHLTLPEVLRTVPGMSVARINSRQWAVSSRGLNSEFANKQLVIQDGKIVYNQLFSGVHWDAITPNLEDIDRIEVVRGPGATLWGANAVNGVINIQSKSARDTQGLLVKGVGGSQNSSAHVRYGGSIGEATYYRTWFNYADHQSFDQTDGTNRHADWNMLFGGARIDHYPDPETSLTLIVDGSGSNHLGETFATLLPGPPFAESRLGDGRLRATSVLLRASRESSDGTRGFSAQSYYIHDDRELAIGFRSKAKTADVEFRGHIIAPDWNRLVVGAGYRFRGTKVTSTPDFALIPDSNKTDLYSAFIQDTVTLLPDQVFAMAGLKIEHNDMTHVEFQPNGRIWWTPTKRQTIWASISRAVRTPSLADTSLFQFTFQGNSNLDAEAVLAYEAGYRIRISDSWMIDIAAFHNDYKDVITLSANSGRFENQTSIKTKGIEIASVWQVTSRWRLQGSYSHLRAKQNVGRPDVSQRSPEHQFQGLSHLELTDKIDFNSAFYYVDKLESGNGEQYVGLDLGLNIRPLPWMQITLWGKNLLGKHQEFASTTDPLTPADVPRAIYGSLRFELK